MTMNEIISTNDWSLQDEFMKTLEAYVEYKHTRDEAVFEKIIQESLYLPFKEKFDLLYQAKIVLPVSELKRLHLNNNYHIWLSKICRAVKMLDVLLLYHVRDEEKEDFYSITISLKK